jgi:cytochrome b pre-mRNA-processing protein 3
MTDVFGFLQRSRHERPAHELYCRAVDAARDPYFYTELAVPDTLDGRFDLVGLHAFLVIRRLQAAPAPGPAVAQAVFDAMFADMDVNLREMGVSDLSVGKRVKQMWEAFHGRSVAYQKALDAGDAQALAEALSRNVWRGGEAAESGHAARLARVALAQDAHLAGQEHAALLRGDVKFLPAEVAA